MTPPRVLVVGDVIDDILATISLPLRHNTDTPARITRSSGGSAANTAVWLAHQGIGVDFVGRVGEADTQRFLEEFEGAGVQAHLSADSDNPTGTIVIVVEAESRTMLTDRGANTQLDFGGIDPALLEDSSWVHLTGYSMFHHSSPESIPEFIALARSRSTNVMVDASSSGFLVDFGVERFLEAIRDVSLVRCNEDEALTLSGRESIAESVEFLGQLFPTVVVTQGAQGVWRADGGSVAHIPLAESVKSVDPTGAGDSFNAGLLAGLVQGDSLENAINRGIAAASLCITKAGARP
ncbi:MAG: carbohydrate kinase family protein [Pontimonas sp.]